MNILHISTSDKGGAANACLRLHNGLLNRGVNSKVLVFLKSGDCPEVHYLFEDKNRNALLEKFRYFKFGFCEGLNRLKLLGREKEFDIFTKPKSLLRPEQSPLFEWADIINLHWVAYLIDYKRFFCDASKKYVWTLHDMNPFTGGCHYSLDCEKYKNDCNNCPQLEGTLFNGYAKSNLEYKKDAFKNVDNLKIITPSKWLMNKSKESALFSKYEHFNIPNGIDENTFVPVDKIEARKKLSLPTDKKILLSVSNFIDDKRKGANTLLKTLNYTKENVNDILICLAGKTKIEFNRTNIHSLGFVELEKMKTVYSAADAYVLPSLGDNLPNTIIESLLCGVPVIAFPVGGIPEMINHGKNGLLCSDTTSEALANSISEFFSGKYSFDTQYIRSDAIERYSIKNQVDRYIGLYRNY